jgi:hypothetical protein
MGRTTKYKQPPHVALAYEVINSKAFKALPHASGKALPFFLAKVKLPIKHPSRHYVQFSFPYGEARIHGFSPSTFSSIIQNLVRYGFIDPVDKGGLRGAGLTNNIFHLSTRWQNYGLSNYEPQNWKTFRSKKSEVNLEI